MTNGLEPLRLSRLLVPLLALAFAGCKGGHLTSTDASTTEDTTPAPPPTCSNGMPDGLETDLDCGGGICPACVNGKTCAGPSDCQSSMCTNGQCADVPLTCSNDVQDGLETDIDCGGGVCQACAGGKTCTVPSDCQSGGCTNGSCEASTLAQAAAAMAPGSWATFSTNFAGGGSLAQLIDAGGGKRITEYADKMVWLSGRKEIHFTGGGHSADEKTIVYTDSDNTWHDLGTPPWYVQPNGGAIHGYQHNTGRGDTHYYLQFGSTTVRTRNAAGGTWGMLDTTGVGLGTDGAIGALEWFPTFGAGSLIAVDGNGNGVYRWNGAAWSLLGAPAMGGYHNVGVYSPIKDLLYFGGGNGSTQLYTLSSAGAITPRASCPVAFGTIQSVTTVDPVSGKLLLVGKDKVIRLYDPATNTWSTDTAPPAGFWSGAIYNEGDVMGIVAAPINDYGVTMFITLAGPTIYLRKGRS